MATVATRTIKYVHQPKDSVVYQLCVPSDVTKKKDGTYAPSVLRWTVIRCEGDSQTEITTADGIEPYGLTIHTQCIFEGGSPVYLPVNSFSMTSFTNVKEIHISLNRGGRSIHRVDLYVKEEGKDGAKGEPGVPGVKGAVLRGPRDWATLPNDTQFQSGGEGDTFIDVVQYNGRYYYCKANHQKKPTGSALPIYPNESNSSYWRLGDNLDFVATKILLSDNARIKNLQVTDLLSYENSREDTGSYLHISGGKLKLYKGGNAHASINIGVENGIPVIQFFDDGGNLLYDLGPNGINKIAGSGVPQDTFVPLYLARLSDEKNNKNLSLDEVKNYGANQIIYKNARRTHTAYWLRCGSEESLKYEYNGLYFQSNSVEDIGTMSNDFFPDGWYCQANENATQPYTGMPAPMAFPGAPLSPGMTQGMVSAGNIYMTSLYRFDDGLATEYIVYWNK